MLLSLALFDAALLAGTYNWLFWHRFGRWAGLTGSIGSLIGLWLSSSYLLGRYSRPDRGRRDNQQQRLFTTIAVSALALAIVVVVLSWGLRIDDPRTFRSFVLPVLGATTLGSYGAQVLVYTRQRRVHQWLAIGNRKEIETLRKELKEAPPSQLARITLVSADDAKATGIRFEEDLDGLAVSEAATLSDADIETLLTLRSSGGCVCSLVSWCEQYLQRVPPELFSSRWLVQAEGFELQPGRWSWRVKRFGDLIVASTLAVLTAPVILMAAMAIKLEDGGPVFYHQIRTGLYGRQYRVWKLRSMRTDAECGAARWAGREDPRITRVGGVLRKLRIDELPQLLSVLKGEMSLIGPRPERPELEEDLEQQIDHYRVRHWVRPGLSGWAQVCFPYGASIDDSRMKLSYDLYYIKNSSFLLDILILIKTVRLVARAQGAVPIAKPLSHQP